MSEPPANNAPGAPLAVTDDTLLEGRVKLRQPRDGYRVAIDPVLLAAAVPAAAGEMVLDVGTGVGAAALCLAWRVPGCRVVGLELQRQLGQLASRNIDANGFDDRASVVIGDLQRPPPRLAPTSFTHVMANPPYMEAGRADPAPHAGKAMATVEGEADLAAWVRFSLLMAKQHGTVTFIHRADRLDQLLALLSGRVGDVTVLPLWPGPDKPAGRVIVQARRDSNAPMRLLPGIVLHRPDGGYTPIADGILRGGRPIAF
ncbi:tRNA1(Val) A37 N6-methylase TrmN6 [Stella humosa]|uniref:tRNA1(Val) A37 N6-methylase TrmN6 n=1 Tax=Stella humosa TaxID=94 RepID=A0A3N1M7P8_9PROT|nr:methyltransferase [Stella humosa]ROP99717.1 tRNA1(Val) A37 N6-methylase TrmN6 [Stella humosa]BBK31056.1 methyltransferase [Stella humosa]